MSYNVICQWLHWVDRSPTMASIKYVDRFGYGTLDALQEAKSFFKKIRNWNGVY